jgi:hypothetical protein
MSRIQAIGKNVGLISQTTPLLPGMKLDSQRLASSMQPFLQSPVSQENCAPWKCIRGERHTGQAHILTQSPCDSAQWSALLSACPHRRGRLREWSMQRNREKVISSYCTGRLIGTLSMRACK